MPREKSKMTLEELEVENDRLQRENDRLQRIAVFGKDIPEELEVDIRRRIAGGLSKDQAIDVAVQQAEHDARLEQAEAQKKAEERRKTREATKPQNPSTPTNPTEGEAK